MHKQDLSPREIELLDMTSRLNEEAITDLIELCKFLMIPENSSLSADEAFKKWKSVSPYWQKIERMKA